MGEEGSGDEEGGCHEEGSHEGRGDEGRHGEGEEGEQRDEESSDEGPCHEEGHEEGQGDRGGMREEQEGRFQKARLLTRSWPAVVDIPQGMAMVFCEAAWASLCVPSVVGLGWVGLVVLKHLDASSCRLGQCGP